MIVALFCAVSAWFQAPPAAPEVPADPTLKIWEEIAGLEKMVRESVNEKSAEFSIFTSDPVRGYYVDRIGVYLLVPIRYRPSRSPIQAEGAPLAPHTNASVSLSEADVTRRLRQWRESMQKEAVNKDAEFESVIGALKSLLPEIVSQLSHLPEDENLTLIIEEREPAWAHVGFRFGKDDTRKLVTLRVVKQALSDVFSRETTFSSAWMSKIKRTNATRPIIP